MNEPRLKPRLSDAELRLVQSEAHAMLGDIAALSAVVIATEDGFDLASVVRNGLDASRVAALASSIAAIGQVVSAEAKLGRARSVIIDTDGGFAAIYSVPRPGASLVINVIAGADALLGQVNYRAAAAVRTLSR